MRMILLLALTTIGLGALFALGSPAGADGTQVANLRNQGAVSENDAYALGGATLVRDDTGLTFTIRMPTPQSGTYTYPEGATPGSPEAFTSWAFVFNRPEFCDGICDGDDLGSSALARGGIYLIEGTVAQTSTLTLGGHISLGQVSARPGGAGTPLESSTASQVHVAVAPHGEFDPDLPGQLTTPIGSPACNCFWGAVFPEQSSAEAGGAGGDAGGASPGSLPSAGSGGLADIGEGASPFGWALMASGAVLVSQLGALAGWRRWKRRRGAPGGPAAG